MNILLIPNLGKKNAYECTCEVIKRLTNYGCSCWMFEERLADFVGQPVQMMTPQQSMDLIISIGGDGTIIHSAHHALQLDCPVLGINAGRLGFLTEIEYNDLDRLEDVVQGRYTIQPRMMLHATVIKPDSRLEFSALNDVVLTTGPLGAIGTAHNLLERRRPQPLVPGIPAAAEIPSLQPQEKIICPKFVVIGHREPPGGGRVQGGNDHVVLIL